MTDTKKYKAISCNISLQTSSNRASKAVSVAAAARAQPYTISKLSMLLFAIKSDLKYVCVRLSFTHILIGIFLLTSQNVHRFAISSPSITKLKDTALRNAYLLELSPLRYSS